MEGICEELCAILDEELQQQMTGHIFRRVYLSVFYDALHVTPTSCGMDSEF